MFYLTKQGKAVPIFNSRPRNYSKGGFIKGHPSMPYPEEDCISSRLEVGSLVIPKKVVDSGVLKDYKGAVFGKGTDDPHRLAPTIVMPGEWVIAREHAPKVEAFLRRKGIQLPLDG